MSLLAPSPISAFEQERLDRIAENRRRMEEMGVLDTARDLLKSFKPAAAGPSQQQQRRPRVPRAKRVKRRHQPIRRSRRVSGAGAEFAGLEDEERVTYSDYEDPCGLDDILADGAGEIESLPEAKQEQFQELRCNSAGRGSVYDSVAGITCHFCRQKKLCGEDGCPRCSRRSTMAECIGKSDCSRCHSATGRFCRACLLIRYGQTLEDVRASMSDGSWLCPHCYEEEHPDEGWMCNSSICMTRRGFKPTGIAIYDAQQRGFPSVAHWLQAQLRKRGGGGAAAAAGGGGEAAGSSGGEGAADGAGCLGRAESAGESAVEAPATPLRGGEAAAAAVGGSGGRVTRAAAAAAAAAAPGGGSDGCAGGDGCGEAAAKRPCVHQGAGTRRSLRFRK